MTTASELVKRANRLLSGLKLIEAEECFQRAFAIDSHSVDSLVGLGRLALVNPRDGDPSSWLDRALALRPDHPEALALKAICSMKQRRFDVAIELLEQANASGSGPTMAYFNLGKCYRELGQLPEAESNFRKAIEINPRHFVARIELCSCYVLEGDFASAFREALAIVKRRKHYADYLRLGSYAVALQQFETAENAFQASIDLNPASWEGHYNLGELYMSARFMDRAREQYQLALDKNPGSYEPFNGMGLFVLIIDQDCARAVNLLKQAIEAAPSRVEPRLNLALAYAKQRDLTAAQKFAASVLTLSRPGDPAYDQAERLQSTIRIESRTLGSLR
jgi:tetratricopeptide (TPR) repeat protein